MTDNNQENFRPQSPLSLYSYVNPAAAPTVQPIANRPPSAVVGEVFAAKSILKKQPAKQITVPSSRPVTPVAPVPLAKSNALQQKTVAFGRTTNLCDTVTRAKPVSKLPHNLLRARTVMASSKELEEILSHMKRQDEEMAALREQNAQLKQSVDELKSKESNLTRALTSLSTRLMGIEQRRHANEPSVDESWLKGISARLDRLEMRAPSPEMMVMTHQQRRPSSNGQRAPAINGQQRVAGEGRIYGAKYTQRLTLHKEITTFSPDRTHLPIHQKQPTMPGNYQSVRISEDENYFDDRSEEDVEEERTPPQQQPQQQLQQVKQRRGTQSDRERRDRYRKPE